jgi:hypothetical protein
MVILKPLSQRRNKAMFAVEIEPFNLPHQKAFFSTKAIK